MKEYEWALVALNRIENNLRKNDLLPSDRRDPKKLRIALLGNTQVGKTTLALRLLGATGKDLEKLSEELRGYRETGKSATAIASIYYALKEHYRVEIFEENKKKWDWEGNEGSEFVKQMNNIRQNFFKLSVKKYDGENTDEIVNLLLRVGLPVESSSNIMSEIVDLVGLGAKSEWERFASKKIADKWIKNCDMPILVFRPQDQADLKSYNFKDLFTAWKNFPLKKKLIVTTWSYDGYKIRKMLDDEQIKGDRQRAHESVLELLRRQIIEQTLADDDLKMEEFALYPVSVVCEDEDYHNASELAVERLEQDIINLEKKGPELFRLKQAFLYKNKVSETINNKQKQHEESIRLKEKCISSIEKKIKKCVKDIEDYKKKDNDLHELYMEILEDISIKIHIKKPEIEFRLFARVRKLIFGYFEHSKKRLSEECKSVFRNIDEKVRTIKKDFGVNLFISINFSVPCLMNSDKDFDRIMNSYTHPHIKKKKVLVKQNLYDWIDKKQILCSKEIQKKFKKDNDSLIKRKEIELKKKVKKLEKQKVNFNKILQKEENEISQMILDYGKLKKNLKKSEKIVNQYDESLCLAYSKERENVLKIVRTNLERKEIHSLVKNIAYLHQLTDEAKYLKSGE